MPTVIVTTGKVGAVLVKEFRYSGRDAGLSHYLILANADPPKSLSSQIGTVEFTHVYVKRELKY